MGYNKIISYGNTLEVYEYEKDIVRLNQRTRRNDENTSVHVDVGDDGKDSLPDRGSEETVGKRADNARRATLDFRRIIAANLHGRANPLLVTLTYRDNFTDLARAYRHFTAFIQTLRYRYGKDFSYISVPEFQKRGAVHFHSLCWGLPETLLHTERETRVLAKIWGHGFVFLKETDGHEKLSYYLAKYFTKSFVDPRLKNQKSYAASRNISRPIVQKGPFHMPYILDEYGATCEPEVDRSYNTKWLGKGRYRKFKLDHDQP